MPGLFSGRAMIMKKSAQIWMLQITCTGISSFNSALDQYKAVLASLAKLKSRTPGELEKHTDSGDKALLEGDAETALTSFTIATSIDRESKELQHKLARAETLDQVQDLVRQGERV